LRFGFCGGSYQSQTPLADAELSINFYPEQIESPNARTAWAQLPTPGLSLLGTPGGGLPSERGFCTVSGRTFSVAGTHLLEWTSNGITDYGGNPGTPNNNILDDGLPAVMVAGGTAAGSYPGQLLIASGGTLTVFILPTNAFAAIAGAPANVLMVEFVDGFFIALTAGNTWQVSNPEDCTTWPGISISQVSVFSDQLLAILETNRLLWVFGVKRAVAYYNAGLPIFPFAVVNGGFMEVGILAQFSVARVAAAAGTTVMWLGGDDRGARIVFAANGFTPQRVSDHAFEYFMSKQASVSDAIGFATQELGHNFYWLYFPTANATWRLDVDLGKWHQMSSLVKGLPGAHLARCHTYNESLGGHLVGDRTSGNVYVMSNQFLSENTGPGVFTPIIRTRIGPTVSGESSWNPIPINEFQVDFETGLGPQPPLQLLNPQGLPRDPVAMFSYSEDFGKTFGPERMIPCGQAGNFKVAAIDRRLGSWQSFTPKVTVSDPIPWRIVDAYINPTQDQQERLSRRYARMT
jgi:hypothetical protein